MNVVSILLDVQPARRHAHLGNICFRVTHPIQV